MAVIFVGILMVGGADFMETGDEDSGMSKAVIGDIIIVCAQVIYRDIIPVSNVIFIICYRLWRLVNLSMRKNTLLSTTFIP